MNRFLPRYSPCVGRHSVLLRLPAAGARSPASLLRSRRLPARGHLHIRAGQRPRLVCRTRTITVSTWPARCWRRHRQPDRDGLRRARKRGMKRVEKYAVKGPVECPVEYARGGLAPRRPDYTAPFALRLRASRPERRRNAPARARRSGRCASLIVLLFDVQSPGLRGRSRVTGSLMWIVRSFLTRTGYSDNTSGVRCRGRPRSAGMRMGRRGTGRPGPALRR